MYIQVKIIPIALSFVDIKKAYYIDTKDIGSQLSKVLL